MRWGGPYIFGDKCYPQRLAWNPSRFLPPPTRPFSFSQHALCLYKVQENSLLPHTSQTRQECCSLEGAHNFRPGWKRSAPSKFSFDFCDDDGSIKTIPSFRVFGVASVQVWTEWTGQNVLGINRTSVTKDSWASLSNQFANELMKSWVSIRKYFSQHTCVCETTQKWDCAH